MGNKLKDNEIYVNIKMIKNKDGEYKKDPYFGKVWGKLPKKSANATALQVGKAGVWVLDIDTKDLTTLPKKLQKLLPKQPTVSTARGYHYYFKGEGFGQTSKLFENVDTRDGVGLAFTSYWGDDERLSWERVGTNMEPSRKLMSYLREAHGKSEVRKDNTVALSYKDGKPWKKFDDGEQHGLIIRTMVKMFNERATDAEVWSRAEEYLDNFLINNRYERNLMKGRFEWAKKEVGDSKLKGSVLSKPKKKKVKVKKEKNGEKKPAWERFILKGGEFDEESIKRIEELTYLSFIPRGHHTFVYGEAGTLKTTIITYEMIDEMMSDPKLKVFLYSFDASQLHNVAMWEYAKEKGVSGQFHILDEAKGDDLFSFIEKANKESWDLHNAVFLIDTYKKIAGNVNDKGNNVTVMSLLKSLTKMGATVVSIGHTNKDGVNNSGTAEIEQDTDGMLRFDAYEDTTGKTVSVTASTRLRFEFEPRSYRVAKPDGKGYNGIMDNIDPLAKYVHLDKLITNQKAKASEEEVWEPRIDAVREAIRKGHVRATPIQETTGLTKEMVKKVLAKYEGVHWRGETIGYNHIEYKLIKVLG